MFGFYKQVYWCIRWLKGSSILILFEQVSSKCWDALSLYWAPFPHAYLYYAEVPSQFASSLTQFDHEVQPSKVSRPTTSRCVAWGLLQLNEFNITIVTLKSASRCMKIYLTRRSNMWTREWLLHSSRRVEQGHIICSWLHQYLLVFKLEFPCFSNESEYEALITGSYLLQMEVPRLQVQGDSKLIIKQVNGEIFLEMIILVSSWTPVEKLIIISLIPIVPQAHNKHADALVTLPSKDNIPHVTWREYCRRPCGPPANSTYAKLIDEKD